MSCASTPEDSTATDPQAGGDLESHQTAGYTQTRYPIVLAHGMSGWKELFGVYDYFYRIPDELTAGGAKVYVTAVSAFASTEERGEQLLQQVEYIAAASGAGKVNLIGHSQGGLDARYVMAARPDLIASLTTVGTPHQGADIADWLLAHVDGDSFTVVVATSLADAFGFLLGLLSGTDLPQDALAAVEQVGSAEAAVFNEAYPAGLPTSYCGSGPSRWNGIALYSWGGTSVLTNFLDVTDPYFGIASLFANESSDGLVGHCSAHFGQVIRDNYRMNHIDEINQLFGLVSIFETSPTTLFRAHANRLRNAGL